MSLSPQHEAFCREYLIDLSAAAAYRRTYPAASVATAETNGPALLRKPNVKLRVRELQAQVAAVAARAETQVVDPPEPEPGPDEDVLAAAWVLRRLKAESEDRGEGSSHAARVAALKILGTHLGMFEERRVVRHELAMPDLSHLTLVEIEHLDAVLGGPREVPALEAGSGPAAAAAAVGGPLPVPLPDPPAEPVP